MGQGALDRDWELREIRSSLKDWERFHEQDDLGRFCIFVAPSFNSHDCVQDGGDVGLWFLGCFLSFPGREKRHQGLKGFLLI
jgi:hypothetical protein